MLNNLTLQYIKINTQYISAATKLIEAKAQMFDSKSNVPANTVGLSVSVFHYVA